MSTSEKISSISLAVALVNSSVADEYPSQSETGSPARASFQAWLPGLNILLADKNAGSTDKQTRNGAGKTSLVELLHFIFAGSTDKNNVFRNDALSQWHFDVQFDLSGKNITASRSGGSTKNIKVTGDCGDFCLQPELHKNSGDQIYTAEQWSNMLGHEMFDLKCWQNENDDRSKFCPTFRMLFPYFVRRLYAGGFLDPHRNSENQQPWDQRVALSYLLGPGGLLCSRQSSSVVSLRHEGYLRIACRIR